MKLLLISGFLLATLFSYSQTFTEIFKAAAMDREIDDRLGYSVDISGNYAIIGCYGDDFAPVDPNMGSAYIFEKSGIEDWTFVQKVSASDRDDYDRFGWSVAIDGDIAVVGAYQEDHNVVDAVPLSNAGSVYVYRRGVDGVWFQMQKLVASDRTADDEFGWSVAISDSTIIVGAHHEGHDAFGGAYEYHAGSAYIFDLNIAGTWVQTQKIVGSQRADDHYYPDGRPDPADEDLSDLFGGSVAISGNYVIVGAHNHDYGLGGVGTGFLWNQGIAYVFERSGGVWTEVEKLQATVQKGWDRFGYDVNIDSTVAIVGVWAEDESEFGAASLMNSGAAYIFERDISGNWIQEQKLDASDRTTGDHFGKSVAIEGNYLVVGAEQEDIDGDGGFGDTLSNAGAAYIFLKGGGGTWTEIQKIAASDRHDLDLFGDAVAISGTTILVGAWQQDFNEDGAAELEDAGAGYFYSAIVCEEIFSSQDITICDGETYEIGESTYTISGTYVDTLLNVDACDSIVTTNLTVIPAVYMDQEISICEGETYFIGDSFYTLSGTYVDTLISYVGCDSIVTTELTVIPSVYFDQVISICFGTTYSIGDSEYGSSGIYSDTLISMTGCDSIVTTNLTVDEEITFEQSLTICASEFIVVGGAIHSTTGTFVDVLTSESLCDSTVTTNLTVLPAIDVTVTVDGFLMTGGDPDVLTTTFQWVKCDPYTLIDGATDQSYLALASGDYAVIITDGDCSDTSDCVTLSDVGYIDLSNVNISVYPNPTEGTFTIELADFSSSVKIEILNTLGKVVYTNILTSPKTMLDINEFANGIYLVRLTNGEKTNLIKLSKN